MQAYLAFPSEWPRGAQAFSVTLGTLAAVDLMFIAAFAVLSGMVAGGTLDVLPWRWDITTDVGFPERFNHLKWLAAAAALGLCAGRTRAPVFAFLSAAMALFFMDDALGLHERLGLAVAEAAAIPAAGGLRARDIGEIVVLGVAGGALVAAGIYTYRKADMPHRALVRRFGVILAGLALCGVVFDAAHATLAFLPFEGGTAFAATAFAILEDGGEMIFTSLAAAQALGALRAV